MPASLHSRFLPLRAAIAILAAAAFLVPAGVAHATSNQISILEDDAGMMTNPAGTLAQLRQIGVEQIRIAMRWQLVAPSAYSTHEPKGFNARNPAARGYNFRVFDALVRDAADSGITLSFDIMGGAPRWAAGGPVPGPGSESPQKPSASQFGMFVQAVATRYNGTYKPAGDSTPLPRVSSWSIWNEPNFGPSLSPQGRPGDVSVDYAP